MPDTWKELAAKKQKAVKDQIPEKWRLEKIPTPDEAPNSVVYLNSILPKEEVAITSQTLRSLAKAIQTGALTSVQITTAFCHRAAFAHQILNCCSEIFFDQALKRAQECDDYYKKYGKVMGPLHGLPVSLKDQVNLPGLDSSIGYCAYFFKPRPEKDMALIAKILQNLGAVFYVKTTVPMAMLLYDTFSNAYGTTQNSINRKLSPGGSSGGEGAMIGSRSALIGLGTDIGGSVRIPSAFNGIFGLRPSHGRIPYLNVLNSYSGQPIIPSVIGPMAQDLDDLEWFTSEILSQEPWLHDPKVIPMPWKKFEVKKGDVFNFGIMDQDGILPVHPPVARALKDVREALKNAGHDTIDWIPQNHEKIALVFADILGADSGKEVKEICALTGEPVTVEDLTKPATFTGIRSVNDHWDDANKKYDLQTKYLEYWNSTKTKTKNGRPVDAWISPVWASASFRPKTKQSVGYTLILNLLDLSVVIVPVGKVDAKIDVKPAGYTGDYDPALFNGAPLAVQVITRRLEEEKAIAMARIVRDVVQK